MSIHYDSVVILSGGLDSTVLLCYMKILDQGIHVPRALSFNYGQRHRRELECAAIFCKKAGVPHEVVDVHDIGRLLKSSQTTQEIGVPEGHYTDETMKVTVVPNRNMIMLSIAAGFALSVGAETLAFAAHAGDHAIYPDCRLEFVEALDTTFGLCDWNKIRLVAPLISYSKAQIVTLGARLGVPFEMTYSCYKGHDTHCGRCGTCVERHEAFKLASVPDPTSYDCSVEEGWPTVMPNRIHGV